MAVLAAMTSRPGNSRGDGKRHDLADDLLVLVHGTGVGDDLAAGIGGAAALGQITVAFADRSLDERYRPSLARRGVSMLPPPTSDSSITDLIRSALRTRPGADVVALVAGAKIDDRCCEILRRLAYADSTTASVSAAPAASQTTSSEENRYQGPRLDQADPSIPSPHWGCVFVRRDALELGLATRAGAVEQSASFSSALETLLSLPGVVHRLTASTLVSVPPEVASERGLVGAGARRVLDVVAAERSLSVLVDLRCCAYPVSGTQIQVLQLVTALSASGGTDLRVLLPEKVDPSLTRDVAALPSGVQRHTIDTLPGRRAQVFHRPYQLLLESELAEAVAFGNRLVITQQDMILSRNPSYFSNVRDWRRFTEMTNVSFLVADHIAFFSPHALRDALSDGVLTTEKASVVPLGTEHARALPAEFEKSTRGFGFELQEPFLLVLGNAYVHKNRVHALRVFDSLARDGGWEGTLVFAGGHPPVGGSKRDRKSVV